MTKFQKNIEKGLKEAKEGKLLSELDIEKEMKELEKLHKKWWYKYYWWIKYGVRQKIDELQWKIPNCIQRVKRGWGNADTWRFDGYLARIISEGCKYLKEHKCGIPCEYLPNNDKIPYESNKKDEIEGIRRWNEVLDKIIFAFKTLYEITSGEKEFYLESLSEEKRKQLNCITKEENDRIEEGKKLFIENFHNLWN